jgi:SAM-dependent methyltransferase
MSMERLSAPAAERNKNAILAVLERVLPARGVVLEIASGTGQHVSHFAAALPGLIWQPTDVEPHAIASIAAWREEHGLPNVRAPLDLDVLKEAWPVVQADAVVCINMIHIAPWSAAQALMRGAGRLLPEGGTLFLYGPYRRHGAHTAPSNEAFDMSLRARNPQWGVRDMEAVEQLAAGERLTLREIVPMPANNFSVVFLKTPA